MSCCSSRVSLPRTASPCVKKYSIMMCPVSNLASCSPLSDSSFRKQCSESRHCSSSACIQLSMRQWHPLLMRQNVAYGSFASPGTWPLILPPLSFLFLPPSFLLTSALLGLFSFRTLLGHLLPIHFLQPSFLNHPAAILHLFSSQFDTLALHVDPAALVAELEFALAGHVVAALILLDPEFALGTLFELLALHEGHELLVVLTGGRADLVLLAGHVLMPVDPAVQTVLLPTLETLEPFWIVLLMKKHVSAVGSGTPGDSITVLLRIGLEGVLQILLHEFAGEDGAQVALPNLSLTVLGGAAEGEGLVGDVAAENLHQAVLVEDVPTLQRLHYALEQVHVADLAGRFLAVGGRLVVKL